MAHVIDRPVRNFRAECCALISRKKNVVAELIIATLCAFIITVDIAAARSVPNDNELAYRRFRGADEVDGDDRSGEGSGGGRGGSGSSQSGGSGKGSSGNSSSNNTGIDDGKTSGKKPGDSSDSNDDADRFGR